MIQIEKNYYFCFFLLVTNLTLAQEISLFNQLNGHLDYTAIGNTLNTVENNSSFNCTINTTSAATLNLSGSQTIEAAYLYWAGSGDGDFDVILNSTSITPDRTFEYIYDESRQFFAAFTDVTEQVQNEGNGVYTLSDLENIDISDPYCSTGTNFAGWAIIIIYSNPSLPLNQINIYDGMESVPDNITIQLNNLNVLDTTGAKIGFLAWEGDAGLAVNEVLQINGVTLSNPPLNPANNAFNGTNSFTNESNLFNMDIDFYPIQNTINVGDTSAVIQLTSGQDLVMVNNIITVLNSQLPDATLEIDSIDQACNSREIEIEFTVFNNNSTEQLPANTPIAFYVNGVLIGQTQTQNEIPMNSSESGNMSLILDSNIANPFALLVIVDDDGTGNGVISEINETNNSAEITIELIESAPTMALGILTGCYTGFDQTSYNLTSILGELSASYDIDTAVFYESLDNLYNNIGAITNPSEYLYSIEDTTIHIQLDAEPCYDIFSLELTSINCEPHIPQGFSPNGDGYNDWFNIQELYTIYLQHELLIYNRLGTLIFKGNNDIKWDGKANMGPLNGNNILPVGTYFYVLHLNSRDLKPITGWVYLNY
jgi:gliding motility-associated-like protein